MPRPLRGNEKFRQIMVNNLGDIYLIEQGLAEIYRLAPDGTILKRNGGFGWAPPQLNQPVDLATTSGLDVVVIDKVNQQLVFFDRQLNFVTNLPVDQYALTQSYPQSLTANQFGEIFILWGESNAYLLRLVPNSRLATFFGGFEYGTYALQQPCQVRIDSQGVVVAVEQEGTILEFDRFGTPLVQFKPPDEYRIKGLIVAGDDRILIDAATTGLIVYKTKDNTWSRINCPLPTGVQRIIGGAYNQGLLYLLFDSACIGVYYWKKSTISVTPLIDRP